MRYEHSHGNSFISVMCSLGDFFFFFFIWTVKKTDPPMRFSPKMTKVVQKITVRFIKQSKSDNPKEPGNVTVKYNSSP